MMCQWQEPYGVQQRARGEDPEASSPRSRGTCNRRRRRSCSRRIVATFCGRFEDPGTRSAIVFGTTVSNAAFSVPDFARSSELRELGAVLEGNPDGRHMYR